MPEWVFAGLISLGGIALTTAGLITGHLISARASRLTSVEQAAATAKATEETASQHLIDQLQEELTRHREAQDARSTAQDERMNRLELYSDGYRNHAHELRAHIWDGKQPPPPEWPPGLPR